MHQFTDDDEGYVKWVGSNPDGFVVNSDGHPNPRYLLLHRARCFTVTGTPSRGKLWTKVYMKTCSRQREELETWARREVGGRLKACMLCNP